MRGRDERGEAGIADIVRQAHALLTLLRLTPDTGFPEAGTLETRHDGAIALELAPRGGFVGYPNAE